MAAHIAAYTTVSIDEYLHDFSFRPDVEYIDGELRERPVVKRVHGRIQSLLSMWFGTHEEAWGIEVVVEVRTRVSATRVRLPDVIVDWAGDRPDTLIEPPLLVIEVLSPGDSYTETQRLAQDYLAMGIPNIWLLDPETRTARVCENKAWIEKSRLEVAGTEIYLDVDVLFARLDRTATQAIEQDAAL